MFSHYKAVVTIAQVFTLGLSALVAHAQSVVPMAPVLCVDGSPCEQQPQPPASGNYNLTSALAQVPFAVALPQAPSISSERVVSTVADLRSSLQVQGRRTILAPGTYQTAIRITGSDKELVATGARVVAPSGTVLDLPGQRIRLIGGDYTGGIHANGFSDLSFTGVRVETYLPVDWTDGVEFHNGNRLLVLNSDWSASLYGAYQNNVSDVVIANSRIAHRVGNGGALVRMNGVYQRVVVVDSLLSALANHAFRAHESGTNIYVARNQMQSAMFGLMIDPEVGSPNSYNLSNIWFLNNRLYASTAIISHLARDRITRLHADGNVGYGNQHYWGTGSGWVVGNNPERPYQQPPAWQPQ